jgi:hypothetical protein
MTSKSEHSRNKAVEALNLAQRRAEWGGETKAREAEALAAIAQTWVKLYKVDLAHEAIEEARSGLRTRGEY